MNDGQKSLWRSGPLSDLGMRFVALYIKFTAPVPPVYLRKGALTLRIKNLSRLSPFGLTTSSRLVPTNIAKLAVYADISPQYIQANKSLSQAIHGAVNATSTPL